MFHYGPEVSLERALVRLNTHEVDNTLAGLEQLWEKVTPEQPFEYEFLDRAFARQYENDEEISRTVTLASVVAILIACMGLFGHATIVLQRRTKEIGVRKVLGATVGRDPRSLVARPDENGCFGLPVGVSAGPLLGRPMVVAIRLSVWVGADDLSPLRDDRFCDCTGHGGVYMRSRRTGESRHMRCATSRRTHTENY